MKRRNYRPWSFRGRMTLTLMACSVLATVLSFVLSLGVSGRNLRSEAVISQQRTAETLQALYPAASIPLGEAMELAAREGVQLRQDSPDELSPEQQQELAEKGVLALPGGANRLPETWVRLGSETVRISAPPGMSLAAQASVRIVVSFVFFLLFFGAASLFAASRLSRPVSRLSEAMRSVADGDFSARLEEDEGGEIGELIRSFNAMAEALARTDFIQKDFVGSVSHEFKTPLAAIKGYARMLQSDSLTPEERREYLDIIRRETDRLSNMSQTLLRLASLEQQNQQYPTQIVSFSLDEELRQAVLTLSGAWQPKEIQWDLELRPVTLRSDRNLLAEVWANLLQNAVKFSDFGGHVRVAVYDQDDAVVEVQDYGIGMDEETRRRVFDRFYQGDSSHAGEGAGLGMTLAKRIVDILGGRISVTSQPGRGTTFTVALPRERGNLPLV